MKRVRLMKGTLVDIPAEKQVRVSGTKASEEIRAVSAVRTAPLLPLEIAKLWVLAAKLEIIVALKQRRVF